MADGVCSICGQTSTDPGPWGDESLEQIQERWGWDPAPMEFESCPECWTVHVCPDCLHEQECCNPEGLL